LNKDDVKQQLIKQQVIDKAEIIAESIIKDKTIEIKNSKSGIAIYEISKKKK